MKKIFVFTLLLFFILSGCADAEKNEELDKYDGTVEEIAEFFVKDFTQKNVDSLIERYNYSEKVEQALNRMIFVQAYNMIEKDNSEFVKIGESSRSVSQGKDLITYRLHYTEGVIKLNIIFENDKLIAGFHYLQEKQQTAYSADIVSQDVEFGSDDFPINATITYPGNGDDFSCIILVPGSGPTDRDSTLYENTPLKDLALGLAEKGIASLRFDKRSFTHSTKIDVKTFTPYEEYIEDVVFAYNYLKSNEKIDSKSIYIAGHSQGGNLIPAFAKEVEAAGYIILAGNVTPLHQLTINQLEYLYNLDDILSKEEESQLNAYKQMRDNINNIEENSDYLASDLMGISKNYWLFYKNYDPINYAKEIDEKILIISGSRDYQVPRSEFELWKSGLEGMDNVDFKLFEGMNHLLFVGEGTPSPQEYMNPKQVSQELINYISEWIK